MVINKHIDFSDIKNDKVFFNGTKQYKILTSLSELEWQEYLNKMLSKNISVVYNSESDVFIAKYLKENLMNSAEQNLDLEITPNDIFGIIDSENEEVDTQIEASKESFITLQDLDQMFSKYFGSKEPSFSVEELPETLPELDGSEEALLAAFNQTNGGVLESEFDVSQEALNTDIVEEIEVLEESSDEEMEEDMDEKEFLLDDEDEEVFEEETTEEVKVLAGVPVQIVLTGVMITSKELNYIGESIKKENIRLRKIEGKGNKLNLIVEYNQKQYTINYKDVEKRKEPLPFSIKDEKFATLDESLKRIKLPFEKRKLEQERFLSLTDNLKESEISYKEADILNEFKNIKLVQTWNVRSVGSVNLKNGINEVYSNITQNSEEKNVLFKTKDGQYFLFKGNLKERSDIGTKKEITDLQNKKGYGIGQVVGVYENSIKGLGQIMHKTQRTSIPLLIWK